MTQFINILIIITGMLLSSCAPAKQDAETTAIINNFIRDAQLYGKKVPIPYSAEDIPVYFKDTLGGNTVALCHYVNDVGLYTDQYIEISRVYWSTYNYTEKEITINHELGHCWLQRPHTCNYDQTNHRFTPTMCPNLLPTDMYLSNRDFYLNELFTNY